MKNIRNFEQHTPKIDDSAWIDEAAVVIGDVEIGAHSNIWPGTIVRGDIHHIRIGDNTNIQDASILHISHDSEFLPGGAPLTIGNGVTVGHKVILHGCTIKDNSLIGMGAIVMDNAIIESHVVVAAGSVVPGGKTLESGYLYVGSPARRVRKLTEKEIAFFDYSATHYVQLAQRHKNSS